MRQVVFETFIYQMQRVLIFAFSRAIIWVRFELYVFFYVIETLETYQAGSYDVISVKSYDFEKIFIHIQRSYVHNQLVTQSTYQYMFWKNVLT